MLDIVTLRIIWWGLIGVLLIGFAVTDGFDFGAAILLPFVTRDDVEKRIVLNTIGPFWEGNQVWIILGAGAIFAAWPFVYAVAFSGAYLVILLLLLTMGISRPVSFKYRSKLPNQFWRSFWDRVVFIGGFVPSIIFGALIGNALIGLPFHFDNTLRMFYTGHFIQLFNPFALLCGITSLMMLTMHGGIYLGIKTRDPIRTRALTFSRFAALALMILFASAGILIATRINGYEVIAVNPSAFSNPLHKTVMMKAGAWTDNYFAYPLTIIAPTLGFLGAFFVFLTAHFKNSYPAFIFSSLSIIGIIATVGVSMFPFILPSSSDYKSSLLVWDSSSTQLTLLMMLVAVIIFLPLIMFYTAWVYRALRGKVVREMIEDDSHSIY